jgi:integration host factor subunit alpha
MPPATGKTLTRADLAEAVFDKVRLPRNEAAELVELVLKQIVYALERGESIKLSSFGSFGLRQKSERVGRNPKTGEVVPITPRRVIIFKASNIMKERINAALSKPAKPAEPPKSVEPDGAGKPAKSARQRKAAKSVEPDGAGKPAKSDKTNSDKTNKAPKPEKNSKTSNAAKPVNSPAEKKRAVSSRRGA